jgi:hypothetical protein
MSTLLAAAGADFALIKLIRNTLSPEMHGHRKITEGPGKFFSSFIAGVINEPIGLATTNKEIIHCIA